MSLLVAVAAVAALWTLVLLVRAHGLRFGVYGFTPALALVVLGLPLLDHGLRHLALPVFVPGSGALLMAALVAGLWRDPSPWRSRLFGPEAWLTGLVLLAWLLARGLAPAFDSFGENIFSLRYVQSLRLASVYPAPDLWGAAASVAGYYTWVHNIAAWLSRAFLLPVPLAMHLAAAALLGLMSLALYEAFAAHIHRAVAGFGALLAMTAGTGTALLLARSLHPADSILLGYPHVRLFNMRPDEFPQPWMAQLAADNPELPVETPLHMAVYLGDLHPPLLTFTAMALLVWAVAVRMQWPRVLPALLGALTPLMWAANPWFAPHAAALAAGLLMLDRRLRADWRTGVLGAAGALVLILPLLMHADFRAAGVSFVWLPAALRATPLALIVLWLPAVLLAAATWQATDHRGQWWRWWLWLFLLVASMEVIHFSQGDMAGSGARFNGVLKVWSPLHFLIVGLGLLGLCRLKGRARWAMVLALPLVLGSVIHTRDVLRSQLNKGMAPLEWSGAGRLTPRADRAFLLRGLQARRPGQTLERLASPQYTLAPVTSLLAGLPTVSGWAHHAAQASGNPAAEFDRAGRIEQWYAGTDPAPLERLQQWRVAVVLVDWDAQWNADRLATVQRALNPEYGWIKGPDSGDGRVSGMFLQYTDGP